jgi:uncharacterized membrane protein
MFKYIKEKIVAGLTIVMAAVLPLTANAAFDGASAHSQYGGGGSLKSVNANINSLSEDTFTMVKTFATLVGLVLVFIGVMRLKKSQDQNSGISPMQGILMMVFGGLCAILPWLLFTSANTVTSSGTTP